MANSNVPEWTQVTDADASIRKWRHTDYDIWMTVSHQSDHYPQEGETHAHDDDEAYEQVLRWHGRVTLGEHITVGINHIEICTESCEAAEEQVMSWARNWMTGEVDAFIEDLDDAEDWQL